MPDGFPLTLGSQNNTATLETRLMRDGGFVLSAFHVENRVGGAVLGLSQGGPTFPLPPASRPASATAPIPVLPFGVWGDCANGLGVVGSSTNGFGVAGSSGNGVGVSGSSDNDFGVAGSSTNRSGVAGSSDNRPGVFGFSTNSIGLFGRSINDVGIAGLSDSGLAAEFFGDVYLGGDLRVTGTIRKGHNLFSIDHPLDPENKYLNHASVESPEMKTFYDGVVELDEAGAAWVQLPEYFEELNRDFRYQLTAIGSPAPELHLAEKISNNRFKIGGGSEGMEVSWQVTGTRKDKWAEANAISVEEDKPDEERGYYLHPVAHDQPERRGIRWESAEERRRQMEESAQRIEEHRQRMEEHHQRIEELRRRMEEGREEEGEPPEATT